ncbi:conserved uncharacterized protein [Elysia marginata]|uniref:Conserved uncharacterized protein n=1 Tax=Elysia marginata TaxID=1093978 RepID=A0AAV4HC90_9GAST|nr:conserved uncharacterized protein [Elysia marginata]
MRQLMNLPCGQSPQSARRVIVVLCLLVSLGLIFLVNITQEKQTYIKMADDLSRVVTKNSSNWSEKWIVITTIAPPTDDVKFVASLEGWRVVVVGDLKTPPDWSWPNCDFLDIKKQRELNFYTAEETPVRSYTRKNIGYLYAIQHGAKVIYETDDDNRPMDKLKRFDYGPEFSGLEVGGQSLFNPYHHFGQSTLWPRGFPLSAVGDASKRRYRMGKSLQTALIQQGIVNGDPDMDAIFRLTRKSADSELDVHFDPAAPSVSLLPGVFSPFNSQNTLFHYEAFWGLLLPKSTTMRVCDIWRGYWAQRLLWEIDGRLAFYPPNAYQRRNSHSYLEDAKEEDQMYRSTEKLLDFLAKWTCDPKLSFFGCVQQLTSDMADNKFLGNSDVDLTKAWLADLARVGYVEPLRKTTPRASHDVMKMSVIGGREPYKECLKRPRFPEQFPRYNYTHVIFYPVEQEAPVLQSSMVSAPPQVFQHISATAGVCPFSEMISSASSIAQPSKTIDFFNDILVIISFNFPNFYNNLRYIEAAYRPIFRNIVYCGPDRNNFHHFANAMNNSRLSFIEADGTCGYLAYVCTLQAMQLGYNVTGYLHVADDVLINPWKFVGMNKSRAWLTKTANAPLKLQGDGWFWWKQDYGKFAFDKTVNDFLEDEIDVGQNLVKYLKVLTANQGVTMRGLSDVYYIPKRLEGVAKHFLTKSYDRALFLEIAIPVLTYGHETKEEIELISGTSIDPVDRHEKSAWDFFSPDLHMLHPVKFSKLSHREMYCSKFMTTMIKFMYG